MVIFLIHILTTLMVAGMIWFIQVVHYPLLRHVGAASFTTYETAHTRLSIMTVVSLMVIESFTGTWLLISRPTGIDVIPCALGIALLVLIWWSTFALQVPQHQMLISGFNAQAYHRLVKSNWIRTAAYTARALLMLWMIVGVINR